MSNAMTPRSMSAATSSTRELRDNRVLRNTYLLLSMTLLFSAATAGLSMALQLPHPGLLLTLLGYFGLLFATAKFRDSGLGLVFVFALTGFMGLTLGPILSSYLSMPGGGQIVMNAMAATGIIFLSLSAYVLTTKRDFSGWFAFLGVGTLAVFGAFIVNYFLQVPALALATPASDKCVEQYNAGAYADAARCFEALEAEGHLNGHLLYDQGNAWYRAGDVGRAIHAWRRAGGCSASSGRSAGTSSSAAGFAATRRSPAAARTRSAPLRGDRHEDRRVHPRAGARRLRPRWGPDRQGPGQQPPDPAGQPIPAREPRRLG